MDQSRDPIDSPNPADDRLVSVFKTGDPALVPLATLALEAEGIEYSVRSAGKADSMQWTMSQSPTNRPKVTEILVTADVAARARDLVIDLEQQAPPVSPADPGIIVDGGESPQIQIEDVSTGIALGTISEGQLQELTSHLEEDDTPGQYFVDGQAIGALEGARADAGLIALLRHAVGETGGVTIRWRVGL